MGIPTPETPSPESTAPRGGLQLMGFILVVMALVAIYSNVQTARRPQTETVTIVPAATTPTPAPAP